MLATIIRGRENQRVRSSWRGAEEASEEESRYAGNWDYWPIKKGKD